MKNVLIPSFFSMLMLFVCSANSAEWVEVNTNGYDTYLYTSDNNQEDLKNRALIMHLKGCSQSADIVIERSGWKEVADSYDAVIAVPGINTTCFGYYPKPAFGTELAHKKVLDVINDLLNDETLNIDANQVYVTGFAAGGSVAMEMACRYPDIIVGVGIASAASIGSNQNYYKYIPPSLTPEEVADTCIELAGDKAEYFQTQIASLVSGKDGTDSDGQIYSSWTNISSDALALVYNASFQEKLNLIEGIAKDGNGTEAVDVDNNFRISKIFIPEMGHHWSSGLGDGLGGFNNYIDGDAINYPEYLINYFVTNNLRLTLDVEINNLQVHKKNTCVVVEGDVESPEEIIDIAISINENEFHTYPFEPAVNIGFSASLCGLSQSENYKPVILVTGISGKTYVHEFEFYLPQNTKPRVSTPSLITTENDCVVIEGNAYDAENDIDKIIVAIDEQDYEVDFVPTLNYGQVEYTFKQCAVPVGTRLITITAQDSAKAIDSGQFSIDVFIPQNWSPEIRSYDLSGRADIQLRGCIDFDLSLYDKESDIEQVSLILRQPGSEVARIIYDRGYFFTDFELELDLMNSLCGLSPSIFQVQVNVVDSAGNTTITPWRNVRVPSHSSSNNNPPSIEYVNVVGDDIGCVHIDGKSVDSDGIIKSVIIAIEKQNFVIKNPEDGEFSFKQCNYETGQYNGSVTVVDNYGSSKNELFSAAVYSPFKREVSIELSPVEDSDCQLINGRATGFQNVPEKAEIFLNDEVIHQQSIFHMDGENTYLFSAETCALLNTSYTLSARVLDDGAYYDSNVIAIDYVNISPVISINEPEVEKGCIKVSGIAEDSDGTIEDVFIGFKAGDAEVPEYSGFATLTPIDNEQGKFSFNHSVCNPEPNSYTVVAIAVDDSGDITESIPVVAEYGSSGNDNKMPEFVEKVAVEGQDNCVTISGKGIDYDGLITMVIIELSDENYELTDIEYANGISSFEYDVCGLQEGIYSGRVILKDNKGGLNVPTEFGDFEFEIDLDDDNDNITPEFLEQTTAEPKGHCAIISGKGTDSDGVIKKVIIQLSEENYEISDLEHDDGSTSFRIEICDLEPGASYLGAALLKDEQGGISEQTEMANFSFSITDDFDNDGIPDKEDPDDDNDMVPDEDDYFPYDETRHEAPIDKNIPDTGDSGGGGSTSLILLGMLAMLARFRFRCNYCS